MAPVAAADPATNRELLVVALGAGSIVASHVNDGGFWLVKEYLGLDVGQTLRSWTVIETIISLTALGAAIIVNSLLS
jgi:GntP family gluconate:H+ symporter